MKKLFQNVAVFYGSLVVLALILQWLVADSYQNEIKAMDDKAMKPVKQIQEHYGSPSGIPSDQITGTLNVLEKKIQDGYKKIQDLVNFKPNPEYRIEAKAGYPQIEFQQKIDKFKAKNSKRLKALTGRFAPSLLGMNQDLTVDKANELLFQAAILEELLIRLEAADVFAAIESITTSPPRQEQYDLGGKMLKKVIRFPIVMDLYTDFSVLDKLLAGLQTGKGYFFLESMELNHAADPESWDGRVRCKLFVGALFLDVEPRIDFQAMRPAWASGIR